MNARVIPFDPLLGRPRVSSTARRLADSRRVLAKHNGDQARVDALVRSSPGPTARRFLDELARVNLGGRVTGEQRTVIVHPSVKPSQSKLPLYDQALDHGGRIPEAIRLPLSVLMRYARGGHIPVDQLLAAAADIDAYNTPLAVPPVVGEGNDACGIPRPGGVA